MKGEVHPEYSLTKDVIRDETQPSILFDFSTSVSPNESVNFTWIFVNKVRSLFSYKMVSLSMLKAALQKLSISHSIEIMKYLHFLNATNAVSRDWH